MELQDITHNSSLDETPNMDKERKHFVFGEIEFEDVERTRDQYDHPEVNIPKAKSQFVKVDPDCDIGELIEEIKTHWSLDHPNLLISVLGGAWDFPVNDGVRDVLRQGIIKTTVGTTAWILTNGINVGVSKYVAKAVKKSKLVSKYLRKKPTAVVTIGIESLSNVRTNQRVKLRTIRRATLTSSMNDTKAETKGHRILDPNHTHFILVDDSGDPAAESSTKPLHNVRENFEKAMNKYMGEASMTDLDDVINEIPSNEHRDFIKAMRLSFPEEDEEVCALDVLKSWKKDHGMNATRRTIVQALKRMKNKQVVKQIEERWKDGPVPVVCIYIEGGHHTIEHACRAVQNGMPIVVVNHSGRAANLMALAYKSDGLKWENEKLEYKLRRITPKEVVQSVLKLIQSSLSEHRKRILWHIYDGTNSNLEIDQVILKALMQANREDSHRQLNLAQTWNRHDIVRTQLFASMRETMEWEDYNAEKEYFQERLLTVIVNNKPGFVRLYLGNGAIHIETYLTRRVLTQLYFEVKKSPLKKILQRKTLSDAILSTLKPTCSPCCNTDTDEIPSNNDNDSQGYFGLKKIGDTIQSLTSSNINPYVSSMDGSRFNETFRNPFHHLFLFAVLNGFHEMAEYFWEEGNEHIATALVAREIYLGMARRLEGDKQTELENMASKYEELACKILEQCRKDHDKDFRKHDLSRLLMRELSPFLGGTTCLKLAESTESRRFIAHPSVQSLVNEVWRHGLPEEKDHGSGTANIKRTCFQKTVRVWTAPRTTFAFNVVSNILLLALFSYILLSNQVSSPTPSWWEVLLIIWVGTILIEELRQIFHEVFNKKWKDYIEDYWNKIDVIMLNLFVVAMIFRFVPSTNEIGRLLLALDLFFFYFRQLHVFTISEKLGPKVIMVFKMFVDLVFFLSILFIILLGYGIAVHSIQFPKDTDAASLVAGILYRPYFQIYGELFIEGRSVLDPDDSCSTNQTEIELGADRCPEHGHIALISLGLYMMISNVLLLNLLIATFSNTFETVQEETDLHWKFHSYALTKEFFQRPDLMPPLIIITDIYRFIIWIMRKVGVYRFQWRPEKIQRKYSREEDERLVKLAELVAHRYVSQARRLHQKDACPCCQFTEMSKRRIFVRLNEFDHLTDKNNLQNEQVSNTLEKSGKWSENKLTVELVCEEEGQGFGFSIKELKILIDSSQEIETVNVIGGLIPGGVAGQDGRLTAGDKLISVNGINIEHSTREFGVQVLKNAGNKIDIVVTKMRTEDNDEIFV
ncbi:transient receptor potential cation channel subfamily M member 5-like [Amphiura filiformis]|uniref:transient receptor potential cation channel subfamily M member 5-like n=1 Tax=Amphiura filiformis TaxID=82378 RepID=UPI003B20F46A